jgi:hypothetical protein
MDEREKIIDRIKKCLALGDSSRNPNENEVANALAAAKRLMDTYNLSMAEVAETERPKDEIVELRMEERSGAGSWEYDLPHVCDRLFGTKHFTLIGEASYRRAVVFVGYAPDVAIAAEVYKLLKMELMGMGREWSYENPSPGLSSKQQLVRRFKYIDGVVQMLIRRAADNYQGFTPKESRALQVMSSKKLQDIGEWLKANRNLRSSSRRETGLHDDAKMAGFEDGKGVSLNFSKAVKTQGQPLRLDHKGGK